jgi:hypothetical protein
VDKTLVSLQYDPKATAYAERVLDWAQRNKFVIRTGAELCTAADAYDIERESA